MPKWGRLEEITVRSGNQGLFSGLVVGYWQDVDGNYHVIVQDPITKHWMSKLEDEVDLPRPQRKITIDHTKGKY